MIQFGSITFDNKSAMELMCTACKKVIGEKIGNTITMKDFININNKIWHKKCYTKENI